MTPQCLAENFEKNHPLLINTELHRSNEIINSRHRKRESAHFQAIHHRSPVQAAPPTDGLDTLDLFSVVIFVQ